MINKTGFAACPKVTQITAYQTIRCACQNGQDKERDRKYRHGQTHNEGEYDVDGRLLGVPTDVPADQRCSPFIGCNTGYGGVQNADPVISGKCLAQFLGNCFGINQNIVCPIDKQFEWRNGQAPLSVGLQLIEQLYRAPMTRAVSVSGIMGETARLEASRAISSVTLRAPCVSIRIRS